MFRLSIGGKKNDLDPRSNELFDLENGQFLANFPSQLGSEIRNFGSSEFLTGPVPTQEKQKKIDGCRSSLAYTL